MWRTSPLSFSQIETKAAAATSHKRGGNRGESGKLTYITMGGLKEFEGTESKKRGRTEFWHGKKRHMGLKN